MKLKAKFIDKEGIRYEVKITDRDNYISFSSTGGGGAGQQYDTIKPATEAQQELINLWKKYHLNGMSAGTQMQMQFLKEHKNPEDEINYRRGNHFKAYDAYIKKPNGEEIDIPKDNGYIYGTKWLFLLESGTEDYEKVEQEITYTVNQVNYEYHQSLDECVFTGDNLEEIKEKYPDENITDTMLAISKILDVPMNKLIDMNENDELLGINVEIYGQSYCIGTYEEFENYVKYSNEMYDLKKDLWIEAVKNDRTDKGLDDWVDEVIYYDGVEAILGCQYVGEYEGIVVLERC